MKLKCPDCGTQYESGKFCQECGSKLQEVVPELVCPSCGFKAKSGKFCPECGTKLSDEASVTVTENCVEEPAVERKFNEKDERFAKYYNKKGFPRNIPKEEREVAIEELTPYVEQNITEAKMLLGWLLFGDSNESNKLKGASLLKEASESGDIFSFYFLGFAYFFGLDPILEQNHAEAEKRLLMGYKTFEDPEFAGALAMLYTLSESHQDYKKAFEYAQIAAEEDEEVGFLALGTIYLNGFGVEPNVERALENYKMAAAHGDATAMNHIGFIFMGKDTYEAYPEQAFYWFNESAQKGDAVGLYNLGNCYKDGYGVERDVEKAVECFKKSAEMGFTDAMFEVGKYYQSILYDSQKSKSWYLRAAELGHVDAQVALGELNALYSNWEDAFKFFKMAAESGNEMAMYNLACRYWEGEGCEENEDLALEWMEKSASRGYQEAIDWLEAEKSEDYEEDTFEEGEYEDYEDDTFEEDEYEDYEDDTFEEGEDEDYEDDTFEEGEDEDYEDDTFEEGEYEDYEEDEDDTLEEDGQIYTNDTYDINLNFGMPPAFPNAEIQNVYFSTDGDKNITVNIDFTVQNMNGKWIDVGVDWYVNNQFKVGSRDRSLITFDNAKFTGFHLTVEDVFYDNSLNLNVNGNNIIKVVIFIGERDNTGKFSNCIYANGTYEISLYSKYHLFGKNEIIFH